MYIYIYIYIYTHNAYTYAVWWLQDNVAAEALVCFNDAEWFPLDGGSPDQWQ